MPIASTYLVINGLMFKMWMAQIQNFFKYAWNVNLYTISRYNAGCHHLKLMSKYQFPVQPEDLGKVLL